MALSWPVFGLLEQVRGRRVSRGGGLRVAVEPFGGTNGRTVVEVGMWKGQVPGPGIWRSDWETR